MNGGAGWSQVTGPGISTLSTCLPLIFAAMTPPLRPSLEGTRLLLGSLGDLVLKSFLTLPRVYVWVECGVGVCVCVAAVIQENLLKKMC